MKYFFLTFLLFTGNVFSESIALVDIQRAINESTPGKEARKLVEEEVKKGEVKLNELNSQYKKLKDDFEKQSTLLSGEALNERKKQLIAKERNLADLVESQQDEIAKKNQNEIGKVVELVDKAIEELVKKEKYFMVMEKDPTVVVFNKDNLEITEDVIKLVNRN